MAAEFPHDLPFVGDLSVAADSEDVPPVGRPVEHRGSELRVCLDLLP